uniref:M1-specific T cell receptor beta chain-like isoform X1 n=1 Tax=Solea senegalensis TaxID=28829 RepID=UPI001CD87617|nr:M1-specific T cell receptor beta chain-like isoform X1 [Solea senegalensis]
MTPTKILICLTLLFLCKMVGMTNLSSSGRQQRHFVSAHVGESITLQCFYKKDVQTLLWYKQTFGHKPRLIVTFFPANKTNTFSDECKDNSRFTLDHENGKILLRVSDLHVSDSAIYLCASAYRFVFEFREAHTVSVEGSGLNIRALVQQSSSEEIQPGGSVNLSCTVQTGMCDGGHRVYWFKNSQESHQGIIYTHGNNSDQCNAPTHSCVYSLSMENLNLSHAGIYYCAVATCGHTVFGDATKPDTHVLVYILSSTLALTITMSIFLAFLLYMLHKRKSCKYAESPARFSASPPVNAESCKSEENLHYSSVRVKKSNGPKRKRNETEDGCVFASVKQ